MQHIKGTYLPALGLFTSMVIISRERPGLGQVGPSRIIGGSVMDTSTPGIVLFHDDLISNETTEASSSYILNWPIMLDDYLSCRCILHYVSPSVELPFFYGIQDKSVQAIRSTK